MLLVISSFELRDLFTTAFAFMLYVTLHAMNSQWYLHFELILSRWSWSCTYFSVSVVFSIYRSKLLIVQVRPYPSTLAPEWRGYSRVTSCSARQPLCYLPQFRVVTYRTSWAESQGLLSPLALHKIAIHLHACCGQLINLNTDMLEGFSCRLSDPGCSTETRSGVSISTLLSRCIHSGHLLRWVECFNIIHYIQVNVVVLNVSVDWLFCTGILLWHSHFF